MNITSPIDLRPLLAVRHAAVSRSRADAARVLVEAGVPVFPCVPGGKRPLTPRGFQDASLNPQRVEWWWRRHPTANLAVPTGCASGIDVVDVDAHDPGSGFPEATWALREGLLSGWAFGIATPSGGMHLYFPRTPSASQRSWSGRGVQGDFRGDGGYVVVPPSVIVSDDGVPGSYRLISASKHTPAPVDATALRSLVEPPRPTRPRQALVFGADGAAPERLANWLASHPEDGRKRRLFWAACRMVEHGYDPATTSDALMPAALHIGLDEPLIVKAIRSAFRQTRPHDPEPPAHPPNQRSVQADASAELPSVSDSGDEGPHDPEVVSI